MITANIPFLKDGRYNFEVEEISQFFLLPHENLDMIEAGGVFSPFPYEKNGPRLIFEYLKNIGFSFIWKLKGPNGERGPTMVSVGRRLAMNHFTLSETLADVSIGSCVSGEKALQILKDFAENPNMLSGAVDWVDIMTLQWPEP